MTPQAYTSWHTKESGTRTCCTGENLSRGPEYQRKWHETFSAKMFTRGKNNFFLGIIVLSFILFLNLMFVGAQANNEIYYKLNLDYDKGEINISSMNIEFSLEKIENYFGLWTAEILNYDDGILNTTFFEILNEIIWDEINPETGEISGGGQKKLDEVSFEIYLPYYENAKEIVIYNESLDEVARISVGEYSRQRGGKKVVEGKEEIKFGFEEEKFEEKSLGEKLAGYWWTFILVFVVLIVVLLNSLKKKSS